MAKKSTKFLWGEGDVTITEDKTIQNVLDNAPDGDEAKAKYLAKLLKDKKVTPEQARAIVSNWANE